MQSDITVISPKLDGYIKEVRVEDNQPVTAGQVMFVIDDRDFAAKVAQAEAAVATAEAAVATYESRLDLQRSIIGQAEAEVTSGRGRSGRAGAITSAIRRSHRAISPAGSASRAPRPMPARRDGRARQDARGSDRRARTSSRCCGRSATRKKRGGAGPREPALARNDLDNTVIRAPVAGVVGNRAGRVGQYVKPGTQLLSLVPLPHVYVTANFKETQLTQMRPGQPAEISSTPIPTSALTGRIESFAPASGAQFSLLPPDNATMSARLKACVISAPIWPV